MDLKIKDKIAIVTGSGQGIGRGIALRLAAEGATVVVVDWVKEDAERTISEITEQGGSGLAIQANAGNEGDVDRLVEKTIAAYGAIDILVNNVAGGKGPAPLVKVTAEDWDLTLQLTLKSAFLCARAVALRMIPRKQGRIINISSLAGKQGEALMGPYAAAKFGVVGLTQVLAKELGRYSITVNAVCPGFVFTSGFKQLSQALKENYTIFADKSLEEIFDQQVKSMTVLGRPQTVEDVGSLVAYLASEEAGNITGQAISVDGGAAMH